MCALCCINLKKLKKKLFYAPGIEDQGVYCLCPVCHSVFLSLRNSVQNFNLANNFSTVSARAVIFHMSIPCNKTFPWVRTFVTLTLEFDLFSENLILANYCSTVSVRIFYISHDVPCEKILLFVLLKPFDLDMWHIFWKLNIIHNKMINIKAFILHMNFSCDKIFVYWY